MFKKLTTINVGVALIFLLTTVFPVPLFSYETTERHCRENWTDESLDYEAVTYKKARCPRCGMEFYYMPGKECPHSHWVHYEVSEEELEYSASDFEGETEKDKMEIAEEKELLGLLMQGEDVKEKLDKGIKSDFFSKTSMKKKVSRLGGTQSRHYELRQKLTCPYDGYDFFPEGDVIEEAKLAEKSSIPEGPPSVIESSFTKSIPFGVSKDLKQFGYDLFALIEKRKEKEKESKTTEKSLETLTTMGLLKAAFTPSSMGPVFSKEQSTSQTAVVPVGPDYIIGPGDTLVISIWGSVQETFPVEVDREGKIILPKAGPLYLWGLKFQEAKKRITERLNKFYTNFNVDVSMGKLREIQVYLMGEVKEPGSYNLKSQAGIFHALYAAGGPTKLGTLRNIKLIHGNGKTEKIDLYPFLLYGEEMTHFRLESGDTVFVPAIGDVLAISGNVKRPAIYETKSEIPLADLLNFAGGITSTGDLQRLQVERIKNNERRIMFDIELERSEVGQFSLEDISLRNGDLVMVSPIVRLKHDFVSILGNVERPGDYALSKDMKVTDLLKRAKGFLPGTYLYRAEIARVTKNRTRQIIPIDLDKLLLDEEGQDLFLNEWDILLVYSEAEVKPPSFVEIDGAINRPGRYELTPGMKISDLIFKGGSIRPDKVIKGAELFHIMPGEQPVVRDISIKRISDINISIDKDIILRAGDTLFIKSEPGLTERKIVTLKGEVRYPGTYSIRRDERLSSIIERAGGFTKDAFLEGVVFTRKSIRERQEKIRQDFLERENRAILAEQQAILLRAGGRIDASQISESLKMRREMLNFIKSADIEGRMVVNLMPLSELKGAKHDILIENGDALTIGPTPTAITVMGSVNNPASVSFEKDKGIEYYIRKTGGLTKHADKNGIYVVRANGEALSKFMMSKKVKQGDTIIIPQEFKYWTPPGQLLRDTVEILSRIAVGVGIIAALD